jgi:hypothetical protein
VAGWPGGQVAGFQDGQIAGWPEVQTAGEGGQVIRRPEDPLTGGQSAR